MPRIFTREWASFLPPLLCQSLWQHWLDAVGVSAIPCDFIVNEGEKSKKIAAEWKHFFNISTN